MIEYWTALMLGLAGSLHCVGMCGPIALALPRPTNPGALIPGRLLYNIGRMLTYAGLGLLFGWMGQTLLMAAGSAPSPSPPAC